MRLNLDSERRNYADSGDRLKSLRPLGLAWIVGLVVIGGVSLQRGSPAEDLFMDATFLGGRAWYVGMVAALGILAWAVSVCGCIAASFVSGLGERPRAASAFSGGALLFALLLLDDLFLFHSSLLPHTLGIPKLVVLGAYAGLACAWLVSAQAEILRTRWELLAAASFAFSISLGVEALWTSADTGIKVIVEDGAKFMGVLALATWSVSSASDLIRSVVVGARQSAAVLDQQQADSALATTVTR